MPMFRHQGGLRVRCILILSIFVSSCQSGVISAAHLHIQQDDWEAADRLLRDELAVHPKNAEAWFLLGTISKHQGIYTRAVYQFEEAARLDPGMYDECKREIDSIPYETAPNRR